MFVLLLGLSYLLLGLIAPSDVDNWLMWLGQPILLVAGAFFNSWVVRVFKERITYPRIGYVAYIQPRGRKRIARQALAFLAAAGIALIVSLTSHLLDERLLPGILGLFMTVGVASFGFEFEVRRFYYLAGFVLVLGGLTIWLSLNDKFSKALLFGGFGLGGFISGALTLARYLRSTQPAGDNV